VEQRYFEGAIAQAALFTYALTEAQLRQLYNVAVVPIIRLDRVANALLINYTGTLLTSSNAAGPYAPVPPGASSPYPVPQTDAHRFYRTSNP
jgi:hypothetical protein